MITQRSTPFRIAGFDSLNKTRNLSAVLRATSSSRSLHDHRRDFELCPTGGHAGALLPLGFNLAPSRVTEDIDASWRS